MPSKKRNRLSSVEQESDNATKKAESLQAPSRLEGEERAFRCDFCTKAFHRKEHLQRHERLHTKEKPFHCTGCSAGFARRDLLARHIRLTHEGGLVPRRDAEAGLARDNEYLVRATPKGLHGGSPTGFTTQDQETSFETTNGPLSNATPAGNETLAFPDPSALIHFALPPSASATVPLVSQVTTLDMPLAQAEHSNFFGDFDMFIDGLNGAYDSVMPSFYANQPILPSPSAPLFPALRPQPPSQSSYSGVSEGRVPTSAPHFFDEFTSTLPSFEPFPSWKARKEPWKITQHDWDHLSIEAQKFVSSIPSGFFLPSRHTMTRYITTYFTGFHRHLPFIHLPTFSGATCPVELILAMATIGAISAFDQENAVMLFRASFSIVQERLRHRKERRHEMLFRARTATSRLPQSTEPLIDKASSTGTEQLEVDATDEQTDQIQPLPLAQTLLILMAMATWGNSEAIFDEAVSIQNILVNYVRSEKLLEPQTSSGSTWDIWIQEEGFKRTVTIIFCFLVFHTIVYDLPPQILSSELNIRLPSRERDWEAQSEEEWQEARREHGPEPHFQYFFSSLFSSHTDMIPEYCSSLGGYILILALIQHIYFLRTATQRTPEGEQILSPRDMDEIERALRNWQRGWEQDLESFLGPASPLGPISFNSTALLRMAYIRLNVDLGPWRALATHDPHEVAISIHRSPSLKTNRRLTRAVLYSAHALSIPVKIGVNIVTHNQAFSWSLQHSLCALECAFIISKWLVAMQPHISEGATDEEEARLYAYIVDMVTEAEAGGKIQPGPDLSTRVVRIWARILSGKAHWNVVSMIGKILEAYAQILEQQAVPTVT